MSFARDYYKAKYFLCLLFTLNFFTLKQYIIINYLNFMINKNSSGFCYVVVYPIAKPDKFYYFGNDYLFYLFLLLKITLFTVQNCSK